MIPRIVTVLRSGGAYDHSYARRLRSAVLKHVAQPVDFVCLTDQPTESWHEPLMFNMPGWWSKLEIFDHERFPGRNIFIDLDTVIRGDINAVIARQEQFIMMRDLRETRANSCLMSWTGDHTYILEEFLQQPQMFAERYSRRPFIGDQAHIEFAQFQRAQTIHYWQDLLGQDYFVNWPLEPERRNSTAPVLWWTDGPKPHEITDDAVIKQHWTDL